MKNVVNVNLTDPINLLIEFINIQNKNYELLLRILIANIYCINKVREARNYILLEGYPRYIFENFKAENSVISILFISK